MKDKHLQRQADNLLDNINDTICLLVKKIEKLENDILQLEEKHEQSLKVAFEKGCLKGYNDHVKLTNTLNK